MDQPAGLLRKMRQVSNVYQSYRLYKREGQEPGKTAKWKQEHSDVWQIVKQVEKLRDKHG